LRRETLFCGERESGVATFSRLLKIKKRLIKNAYPTPSHTHTHWSVGSIKLYVSFAEYSLFYRVLLQKRPIILSILLTKATPYMHTHKATPYIHCETRQSMTYASYLSLLQNILSFIGFFCKRDLQFNRSY